MATTYFPRLPTVLIPHFKRSPWLDPYHVPKSRRVNHTRYVTGKRNLALAFKRNKLHAHVDASGIGLGMSLQGSSGGWQRWVFNKGSQTVPRSPASNQIDSNWSELLAVYLTLHTLVELGHHASRIVLHNDNTSVVESLQRHANVQPSLWGISGREKDRHRTLLKKIGELVEKHGIDLKVEWVSTKANLADGASRGKRLLPEKRLRYGADVPFDLSGVVVKV